jgi:rhodanese-related sulfurtransferase
VDHVRQRLDRGEPVAFLDVRNPQAWASANVKIPGAIRVPLDELPQRLGDLPRDRPIVAYCT